MKPAAIFALCAAAAALIGAGTNWTVKVTETEGGHLIGNPKAKTRLTEFVSYTCSHCARFTRESDGPLKLVYVPSGELSVEIRHTLRDKVDWTAALLAHCGEPAKFPGNHNALMLSQDKWFEKWQALTDAQIKRWNALEPAAARRAIASDLGFYAIMASRGYERPALDRCLNDNDKAASLATISQADAIRLGIKGTPSFAINGKLLADVHSWPQLRPMLDQAIEEARTRATPAADLRTTS